MIGPAITTASRIALSKMASIALGNASEIKPGLEELNMGQAHPIDISIPGAPTGGPQGGENQQ